LSSTINFHELSHIRTLLPNLVNLTYVSSDELNFRVEGKGKDKEPDVYEEAQKKWEQKEYEKSGKVLVWEWKDGEVRSEGGSGKVTKKGTRSVNSIRSSYNSLTMIYHKKCRWDFEIQSDSNLLPRQSEEIDRISQCSFYRSCKRAASGLQTSSATFFFLLYTLSMRFTCRIWTLTLCFCSRHLRTSLLTQQIMYLPTINLSQRRNRISNFFYPHLSTARAYGPYSLS
jgi:hypothetical protein